MDVLADDRMPAPFPDDGAIVTRDSVGQQLTEELRQADRVRATAAKELTGSGNLQAFANSIRHHRRERPVAAKHMYPVGSDMNGMR